MSHPINTAWIESAHENFEEALTRGDIALAKAIIADVIDAGFTDIARSMNLELRNVINHD